MLTAILAAVPSGLGLHEAYEHTLEVWRQSDEGKEVIQEFNDVDVNKIEMLDIRHFLSGHYDDPTQYPLLFLCKTMNRGTLRDAKPGRFQRLR